MIDIRIYNEEKGYSMEYKTKEGFVFSQGDTLIKTIKNSIEAISLHFDYDISITDMSWSINDISFIIKRDIFKYWNQPHRFYHNEEHLDKLIEDIMNTTYISDKLKTNLIYIALYHDIVYEPKMVLNKGWNENESANIFLEDYKDVLDKKDIEIIYNSIIDTSKREYPLELTSRIFWELDNSVLLGDINELIKYETKIRKEFEIFPIEQYIEGRYDFLIQESYRYGDELKKLADLVINKEIEY